ncbi:MAG: FKBP-type peptidyl-prolyl cis-trans isomerase [Thermoplasmata archaeon]
MNNGDFIKIDYSMRVGDDKKLVSTSSEQLAKDNSIFNENTKYGPIAVVVGADQVFKKIDNSFKEAQVDKEVEVTLTPEEAYGVRDPKNIKVHSYIEFKRQNIDPVPGQEIYLNHRRGKVLSVTPGRVLVDYNPPHAGKTIVYSYTLRSVISDPKEKVLALIEMNYPVSDAVFTVISEGESIRIEVPEASKFDPVWMEAKFRLVNEIRKYLPGYMISIVENYTPGEPPKQETTPEGEVKPEGEAPAATTENPPTESPQASNEQGEAQDGQTSETKA